MRCRDQIAQMHKSRVQEAKKGGARFDRKKRAPAETVIAVKAVRGKSSGALPVDVLTTCHDGKWQLT